MIIILLLVTTQGISFNTTKSSINNENTLRTVYHNKFEVSDASSMEKMSHHSNPSANYFDIQNNYQLKKEVIIFANSPKEFREIHRLDNVRQTYEHLMAVRVNTNKDQFYRLSYRYNGQLFLADQFREMMTHQYFQSPQDVEISGIADSKLMEVEPLWNAGYNGSGVIVGVFDNGVNFNHSGLKGQLAGEIDVSTSDSFPCETHGTPVAGAIASTGVGTNNGDYRGTAFGSKIYAVSMGCGDEGNIKGDFLEGFDHLISKNNTIDIINTSWGGGGAPWDFITQRIEEAGQILVGSAGNAGPSLHTVGSAGPGNSIHGISVGAIDYNEEIVPFSSRGPMVDMLIKPDLLAPGLNVVSTLKDGSYGSVSGTSFSSPLTSGALATLISAINNQTYDYNTGLLKAALLRGADLVYLNELASGQGIVNLANSWNLVDSATLIDNVPALVEMTPRSGPLSYLKEVPAGVSVDIPLTLISSHPENVSFGFTGDLSGIASLSTIDPDRYSQKVILTINTTGFANSNINGKLTASVGSDSINSSISMSVLDPVSHTVGMDTRHTYWDQIGADQIGGSNTGLMAQLAMRNGYWVEEVDQKITSSVLSNYDIFWMPDPLNLIDNGPRLNESSLLQKEIKALVDFVENDGGNLMIDFNGLMEFNRNDGSTYSTGLNATGMNKLISTFNITASTTAVRPNLKIAYTNNVSSIVGAVSNITHFGNQLFTGDNSEIIAETPDGLSTLAIHTNPSSGGRVLVSSTNFWLDNYGIMGLYQSGSANREFAMNTLNWLSQDQKIIKLSQEIDEDTIRIRFKALDGSTPLSGPFKAKIVEKISGNKTFPKIDHEGNNIYSISQKINFDGIWKGTISYKNDYIGFKKTFRGNGPRIIPNGVYQNNSIIDEMNSYEFSFNSFDPLSELRTSDFSIKINNSHLQGQKYSYDRINKQLKIKLNNEDIPVKSSITSYVLNITAFDDRDNPNTIYFIIGIKENRGILDFFLPIYDLQTGVALLCILILIPIIRKRKFP